MRIKLFRSVIIGTKINDLIATFHTNASNTNTDATNSSSTVSVFAGWKIVLKPHFTVLLFFS